MDNGPSMGESLKLDLYEKYSVARRRTGHAQGMIIALTYPHDQLPPHEHLSRRIDTLLEAYPLLSAAVVERDVGDYHFETRPGRFSARDILKDRQCQGDLNQVLDQETKRLDTLDPETDPWWSVVRYTSSGSDRKPYLVVWSDHTITDGRGLTRIVSALLNDEEVMSEGLANLERMDGHPDFQPPLEKPKAIVLPGHQSSIPPWPRGQIKVDPASVPSNTTVWNLSAASVTALKDIGRRNGVQTLHAILNAVWLVGLWSVVRQNDEPWAIETGSPRSERPTQPDGKQAWCTANYVSLFSCLATLRPDLQFWTLALDLSNALRSDEGVLQGRRKIGALAHLSNQPESLHDGRKVGGWEAYLLRSAEKEVAYKEGLQVSNLGFFDLPPKAEGIMWKMNPSPFGPAVTVQLIGHRNGLGVSTAWREGSVVDISRMGRVQKVVETVISRLAGGAGSKTTLADLVKNA